MSFRRGQLEYFVAVADHGQMTSAARRLGIAQPALSQAIAQLETELGLKLLDRHPRGVTLTRAGEAFYAKARVAVDASAAAASAARSLARGQQGAIEFGFLGSPPSLTGRLEMDEFAHAHPDIDIHYRELTFPSRDTAAWLADVDVAACHEPPAHEAVWSRPLRAERRVALLPATHQLAQRRVLTVAELLDETFVGLDPSVDPQWAGFWSLDDHRGGPPERLTADRACNSQEMIAALRAGTAVTLVPELAAIVLGSVAEGLVATPVRDAAPGHITLVGHVDRRNPLVGTLLDFAEAFAARSRAAEDSRLGAGSPG